MRNPNGYGGVTKMPGNRRKPYRVRITTGWSDEGRQQYKVLGYFATQKEALMALSAYHENPYDLNLKTATFSDIYEKWSAEKYPKISRSGVTSYQAAYKLCGSLYHMRFADIRKSHMQAVVDHCGRGPATQKNLRTLFNQLFTHAMENDDAITKNYASFVTSQANVRASDRIPFSEAEIQTLWDNLGRMDHIDTTLIMIYTGWRIGELLLLSPDDIHLNSPTPYMRGGIKTNAGKNRVVPIHPRILPLVQQHIKPGKPALLLNEKGRPMSYDNFYNEKWKKLMEQLHMTHRPHDTRHTFASRADTAGMNKLCIKRIMGHSSVDITDKIYTHKEIEELYSEILKLP